MRKCLLIGLLSAIAGLPVPAGAQFCPGVTPWVFEDVPFDDPFCGSITWMASQQITLGCEVIDEGRRLYCPDEPVSRKGMAAFMRRLGDALFPLDCASGQVLKWNGVEWSCATDAVAASPGTVTSVAVGSGLTASPNPITGVGAINLATTQLLPATPCGINQVPKWSGSSWTCQGDANSGGTVTSVASGTGLTGGPITGSGTLSVATGGITATQLASNAVTTAKVSDGSITMAKLSAGAGSAGQQLASNGSGLVWVSPPATVTPINPLGTSITTVDASGSTVGYNTSVARGTDGLPVISYLDVTNAQLKVAKCVNAACTGTSVLTPVDGACAAAHFGGATSIAIGADGFPMISYTGPGPGGVCTVKVAKCVNAACTGASVVTTIDTSGATAWYSSITLGADGLPVISYRRNPPGTPGHLMAAKCGSADCSTVAAITQLDNAVSGAGTGLFTSIALGADGLPVIGYYSGDGNRPVVAKCANAACSAGTVLSIVDGGGDSTSIALGADGFPVISYRDVVNTALRVAKCVDAACTLPVTTTTIDNTADVGYGTSIALGPDGFPVVSYFDNSTKDLKGAKCANAACTGASITSVVDGAGDVGYWTGISMGADGLPVISYTDFTNGNLKVVKCSSATCMPFVRSR